MSQASVYAIRPLCVQLRRLFCIDVSLTRWYTLTVSLIIPLCPKASWASTPPLTHTEIIQRCQTSVGLSVDDVAYSLGVPYSSAHKASVGIVTQYTHGLAPDSREGPDSELAEYKSAQLRMRMRLPRRGHLTLSSRVYCHSINYQTPGLANNQLAWDKLFGNVLLQPYRKQLLKGATIPTSIFEHAFIFSLAVGDLYQAAKSDVDFIDGLVLNGEAHLLGEGRTALIRAANKNSIVGMKNTDVGYLVAQAHSHQLARRRHYSYSPKLMELFLHASAQSSSAGERFAKSIGVLFSCEPHPDFKPLDLTDLVALRKELLDFSRP